MDNTEKTNTGEVNPSGYGFKTYPTGTASSHVSEHHQSAPINGDSGELHDQPFHQHQSVYQSHVYANPSFSGYPEIPEPDYPRDPSNNGIAHDYYRSRSNSSGSWERREYLSSSMTRRASSPENLENYSGSAPPPSHQFYTVPLDGIRPVYGCPPCSEPIAVTVVPEDYSYWTYGIYSTVAFVTVLIIILLVWGLLYWSIW